jgi:hypothetical protein
MSLGRPDRGFARLAVIIVIAVVVIGGVGAAIAGFHRPNHYRDFRRRCLAQAGTSVVVVGESSRNVAMGAAVKQYTMGCRQANGTISSTVTTSKP